MADECTPRLVRDEIFGYRKLDPLPASAEIREFYRLHYSRVLGDGGRARPSGLPPLSPEDMQVETRWREETLFREVADTLESLGAKGPILDVGCGGGDLLAHLRTRGFEVTGVEPSEALARCAVARGVPVEGGLFHDFGSVVGRWSSFGVVVFLNVFEHVIDPQEALVDAWQLLRPGGVLCIRVPNDFSELQEAALAASGHAHPWWVCAPDHVTYFTFDSLRSLLEARGFQVCRVSTDFPMELFMLMGEDYVSDPGVGRRVHAARRRFDLALPVEVRRRFYAALAAGGFGRNIMMFARKAETAAHPPG